MRASLDIFLYIYIKQLTDRKKNFQEILVKSKKFMTISQKAV